MPQPGRTGCLENRAADDAAFVDHYNGHRPHRAELAPRRHRHPPPTKASPPAAAIHRHDRLGGLIEEYTIAA
jgi:hypothetical protein